MCRHFAHLGHFGVSCFVLFGTRFFAVGFDIGFSGTCRLELADWNRVSHVPEFIFFTTSSSSFAISAIVSFDLFVFFRMVAARKGVAFVVRRRSLGHVR